jgi:hypothetical protein
MANSNIQIDRWYPRLWDLGILFQDGRWVPSHVISPLGREYRGDYMGPHSLIWLLDPESAANTSFAMINTWYRLEPWIIWMSIFKVCQGWPISECLTKVPVGQDFASAKSLHAWFPSVVEWFFWTCYTTVGLLRYPTSWMGTFILDRKSLQLHQISLHP